MSRLFVKASRRATAVARFSRQRRGLFQAGATVLAIGLGYWGWTIKTPPVGVEGWLSNLFRTFQLITLNFPSFDTSIPWQLQIARLAVPLAAALATFNILVGSITRPVRLALLPRTSGHIVVIGPGRLTDAALLMLAERGEEIVSVSPGIGETHRDELEGYGVTVVETNPLHATTFERLNLASATALFLLQENDVDNLNMAMLAISAMGRRTAGMDPLTLAMMIDREDLAGELDLALDRLARRHGVRYRRISPDREGLRLELARYAPVFRKTDLGQPSHAVVIGLAGAWQQALMQIIVAMQDHPDTPPLLSLVVTQDEAEEVRVWREARPDLPLVVAIETLIREGDVLPPPDVIAAWTGRTPAPQLGVVLETDAQALVCMLRLRRAGQGLGLDSAPILIRQSREDRILAKLAELDLADWNGRDLVPFGGLLRAESIAWALDYKGDERAMALHEAYRRASGGSGPGALGWDDLPENLKEANRTAAAHVPIMLAAISLGPLAPGQTREIALSPDQIERLARIEHRRWCANRIAHGWRHGASRDDRARLHPALVAYEALTESERDKDRATVVETLRAALPDGVA